MNRNRKIAIIIIILLILAGIIFFMFMKPNSMSGNETKMEIYNNGTSWMHVLMAFENVTMKNGTKTTFYIDAWLKPGNEATVDNLSGNALINLSDLLGYGNQAIPNGVKIPAKIWINIYRPNINESYNIKDNASFFIQGWSMNSTPPENPKLVTVKAMDPELYNFKFQNIQVNPLPSDITDNKLTISQDSSAFATSLAGMGNNTQFINVIFVDVDNDFKLIIDKNSLLNLGSMNSNPDGSTTIDARNNPNRTIGPNTLCIITT
ncbi:hypothetical protein [Methanobacterium sp.]|uniref:hypothetical protein n=1 Tax=Methanobacterium sp. TaxID=2164 RepID=UPI003C77A916